jgi:AcrR family transcriptional regulator
MQDVQPRKRGDTRERILELAEASVLAKGFAATSIDELIAGVGITKSGFFYHFADKGELAKAMLERYLEREDEILNELDRRAGELHEDPLHGFLVALKMLAEMMENLPETHPGCLVASYCYQENLFNKDVRELSAAGVLGWRRRFRERLDLIAERYPPRVPVDLDALADMVSVLVDGGIIISKVVKDKHVLPKQVMLFRQFIRSIFLGEDGQRQ